MANFRQVHTKIWKDDWFLELQPIHKLFFVYLFTNECASICGLYELSKRVMAFESGLTYQEIDEAFATFVDTEKAYYQDNVVWVANLRKYHETKSPKLQAKITKDLDEVKECQLKVQYRHVYGIDRVSDPVNTVSIPPYTSTSTITNKSYGGSGGKPRPQWALPEQLNTDDFGHLWAKWYTHLYNMGIDMTWQAGDVELERLSEWGETRATKAIKHSMRHNWKSIHEPDKQQRQAAPASDIDIAWGAVISHMQQHGSREPYSENGATGQAIKMAGGYDRLCKMQLKNAESAFKAAYQEAVPT